jgi:hypothetical protein
MEKEQRLKYYYYFMPSRNKIKTKQEKKIKIIVDTELAKIDSEKNTDREEVALHLLFVKVPQIHVNLQLLLQNLILFLQEFILNVVVFVVETAAQLRLRHYFRNPAPNVHKLHHIRKILKLSTRTNTPNGGARETHTRRDKRRERAELRNAQRLVLLMYSARKKIFL